MSWAGKIIVLALLVQALNAKSIVEFLKVDKAGRAKLVVSAATCMSSTGMKSNYITDLQNLKFADDPVINSYMKCYMDKAGWTKGDGDSVTFDMDTINKFMMDQHKDTASKCVQDAGTKSSEAYYAFYKCLMIAFHK